MEYIILYSVEATPSNVPVPNTMPFLLTIIHVNIMTIPLLRFPPQHLSRKTMHLFPITQRCQTPSSFRVKDALLNKEKKDILQITEAFFPWTLSPRANLLPLGGGEDWHLHLHKIMLFYSDGGANTQIATETADEKNNSKKNLKTLTKIMSL